MKWTADEDQWLIEHNGEYERRQDMVIPFNAANKTNRSFRAIEHRCQDLGLIRENGWHGRKDGHSFKSARLGEERIRLTGSTKKPMWFVKVSDELCGGEKKKNAPYQWEKKHLLVWRKAHGEIQKGGKVVFLNSDTTDCRLENLYLTTDAIHMMMIANGWYSTEPELTRTELKCCELELLTK